MKLYKRIILITLSAVILTVNISFFALKPIQTKAAAIAVPVAEVGSVLWNLLMTAFVAVGAYEILDNYNVQKSVYDEFLRYSKTLTLPDGEFDVEDKEYHWPLTPEEYAELEGFTTLGGGGNQEPEEPDGEKPPDRDAWKNTGKNVGFAVGGAFLAKVGDFVKSVFDDKESELSQTLFDSSSANFSGWTGEYTVNDSGKYIYTADVKAWMKGSYNGQPYLENLAFVNSDMEKQSYGKCAAYLVKTSDSASTIWTYQESATDKKGYSSVYFPWKKGAYYYGGVNHYVGSVSAVSFESINLNMPVFTSLAALETYFLTGVCSSAVNYVKPVDFTKTVPQVSTLLSPLTRTQTGTQTQVRTDTQTLTDTLTETQTQVQTQPQIDTETYTKIFTQALEDAITKTQTKPQPTPQPSYPDTSTSTETGAKGEGLTRDWKLVFPFCIPFDMVSLIRVLEAEPKAPRFEIPVKSEHFDIDYVIVIDLAGFDAIARIFRLGETVLFIIGLMVITGKVIKW